MSVFGFCVVIDIILRRLLGANMQFLQETGKFIMVGSTLLGASMAVRLNKHPAMSTIIDIVPTRVKYLMQFVSNLLSAGIIGFVFYFAWRQFLHHHRVGTVTSSMGNIPVWALYSVVPVCLFTMSVRFFMEALLAGGRFIKGADEEKPVRLEDRERIS